MKEGSPHVHNDQSLCTCNIISSHLFNAPNDLGATVLPAGSTDCSLSTINQLIVRPEALTQKGSQHANCIGGPQPPIVYSHKENVFYSKWT